MIVLSPTVWHFVICELLLMLPLYVLQLKTGKKKTTGKFAKEFINKLMINNRSNKLYLDYKWSLCEKLTHDDLNYGPLTDSDG